MENEYPFSRVIKLYDTVSINTESDNRVIVFGGRIDNALQSGTVIAQFDGSWSQLGTGLANFIRNLFCILISSRRIPTVKLKIPGKAFWVTSMLVTDVGDQMCW